MENNKQKKITAILFAVYFVILTWIIVFKMETSMKNLIVERSINLVPFKESVIVNGRISFLEIIQNAIVFIPVGVFTAIIAEKQGLLKKIAIPFGISLVYEIVQYILSIGRFDITDLINNTLGGIVGIAIILLRKKILKDKTYKIVNIFSGVCIMGIVILLGLITFIN